MREYIVPIYDGSPDYDEIFVGYIRENATGIVRCKDCQYTDEPIYEEDEHDYWCRENSIYVYENDFCSYGERRNENV